MLASGSGGGAETPPRCPRCGAVQPYGSDLWAARNPSYQASVPESGRPSPQYGSERGSAAHRYEHCVYCGATLGPSGLLGALGFAPPVMQRVRWSAVPPAGSPARARIRREVIPYEPPGRYLERPWWSFVPSIWRPTTPPTRPAPRNPVRNLRGVAVLAAIAAAVFVVAAVGEAWRYLLLVRGRTEVLPAVEVRVNDAIVQSAAWSALVLAVAAVALTVLAIVRASAFAAHRAGIEESRFASQRLAWLLVPGWNLFGAGVVVAELDSLVQLSPPAAPAAPGRRLRWTRSELARLGRADNDAVDGRGLAGGSLDHARRAPPPDTGDASGDLPAPKPHRLVAWWWWAWAINGVLATAVLIRQLVPGDLQVRADLVLWHVLLNLVAATVAGLTAALLRRWATLLSPSRTDWPSGWQVLPPPATAAAPESLSGAAR